MTLLSLSLSPVVLKLWSFVISSESHYNRKKDNKEHAELIIKGEKNKEKRATLSLSLSPLGNEDTYFASYIHFYLDQQAKNTPFRPAS